MWKRNNIRTTHHIVPRHEWGTNDEENLIRLQEKPHQALHILHQTRLIAEQLIHTVELSQKAMRPEVVEWLVDTLTAHDPRDLDFWYKDSTHI
jgi:ATP sulfurylase